MMVFSWRIMDASGYPVKVSLAFQGLQQSIFFKKIQDIV